MFPSTFNASKYKFFSGLNVIYNLIQFFLNIFFEVVKSTTKFVNKCFDRSTPVL